MSVIARSRANQTARLVGADMETLMGMFLMATLGDVCEETLPLVSTTRFSVGMSSGMHSPRALPRPLCRPMSPAEIRISLVSHNAAEWVPPVAL